MMRFFAILDRRRHFVPVALLILSIFAANFLALSGLFNDDPALFLSGLQTGVHVALPGQPNWYDPNVGFTVQALGRLAADDWLNGRIPWWNPYSGVGMPLAAELQNYAMFLPFVLLLHFQAGWLWLRLIFQIFAGGFTYAFLYNLGLSRFAATLAGIMYGCSSSFILIANAPSATFAFLPLLLFGIEQARAAAVEHRPTGWSIITLAVAYAMYAGFPETAFMQYLFALVWVAVRLGALQRAAAVRFVSKFILGGTLGIALTGPCLLPFIEYVHLGSVGDHQGAYAHSSLAAIGVPIELLPHMFGPFATVIRLNYAPKNLLLIDKLYSTWGNTGGWLGILPVMLAVAGLATPPGQWNRIKWMLFGWVLVWQARTFGLPGLTTILNLIYPLHFINTDRYAEPSCDFAIIVLGAIALNGWQRQPIASARILMIALITITFLSCALLIGMPTRAALATKLPLLNFVAIIYLGFLILQLAVTLLILKNSRENRSMILLAAVILFDTMIGFGFSQLSGTTSGTLQLSGNAYLERNLGLNRAFTLGPIAPNYGAPDHISEIDYIALPAPALWTTFVKDGLDPFADPINFTGTYPVRPPGAPDQTDELTANLDMYKAIGVKYVVAPPRENPFASMPSPPPLVFGNNVMHIYQLANPAPYYAATGDCILTVQARLSLTANCTGSATLTRQELFYPGWNAAVNGQETAVSANNRIFQSIPLPAGRSQIVFWYRPTHIRLACAIAIAAILTWVALGLASWLRRPRIRASPVAADI